MKFEGLSSHIPPGGLPLISDWLKEVPIVIKIKNTRRTKLGDYKFDRQSNRHQISIDKELDPYAFFFVLTHEIAHLKANQKFGNKVKSHGNEWKIIFGNMLIQTLEVYTEELKPFILNHARSPKASVGADKFLFQKLFLNEIHREKLVENIQENQKFRIGKRVFQRGAKRKIRYICKELKTGRMFLVNGQAIVDEIIKE